MMLLQLSTIFILSTVVFNEETLAYSLCESHSSDNCNGTRTEILMDVKYIWNRGASTTKTKSLITEGVFVCLIILMSLIGNGALIGTVILEERFRTPTNLLVISQCIADLGLTFIVVMLSFVTICQGGWQLSPALCLMQVFFNRLFLYLTVLNFALLAIDRYIVIVKTKSLNRFSKKHIFMFCCGLWAAALALAFPWDAFLFPSEIWFEVTTTFCYARHTIPGQRASTIIVFVRVICLLIIPGLIIIFCFYHIFGVVRTNRRKVGPSTVSNWRKIAVAVYAKSAYTSIAVLISFCVCIVPFLAIFGLSLIGTTVSYRVLSSCKDIYYANAAIKPFIYIARSVPWSKKLRRLLVKRPKVRRAVANSPASRKSSRYVVSQCPMNQKPAIKTQSSNAVKHFSTKDFHELFCVSGTRQAWDNDKK